MNNKSNNSPLRKKILCTVFTIILSMMSYSLGFSQYYSADVNVIQNLYFGYFYPVGSGGNITVNSNGIRTNTNGVVVFSNPAPSEAIFQISSGYRKIFFVNIWLQQGSIILRNNNGNGQMTLVLTQPTTTYLSSLNKYRTYNISIGGTLQVGSLSSNPAGTYTGTFDLVINYL